MTTTCSTCPIARRRNHTLPNGMGTRVKVKFVNTTANHTHNSILHISTPGRSLANRTGSTRRNSPGHVNRVGGFRVSPRTASNQAF